ncbi:MAG TPA: threo-3-hydroxy-L-aspartate ammonia-lyase [Acidimicrobiales bacterium]|nr:threo-3-hydroxy-L-aspartate ammonia-lyase [Acidimicrobiales bacterium]
MITLADVEAAARRLDGVANRTPVLTSRTLDERTGAAVFLKAEPFQRSGAFKFRGAYNRLAQLDDDERRTGVVAFSSGNHAQAVALASRLLDIPATILMPHDAPPAKLAATRGYGAEVVLFDRYTEDREALGRALESERGLTLVPPYDDERIMAGQGTAALELVADVPGLDVLVAPVGGGGLLSGCAVVAKAQPKPLRVVGVEPAAGDDVKRSLEAGERVTIGVPKTIADGQQTTAPGVLTFEVLRRNVDDVVLVSDDELVEAMALCFDRLKLVTEPSGVCGLAALLAGHVPEIAGQRVGVIISGGNVGTARFVELLSERA